MKKCFLDYFKRQDYELLAIAYLLILHILILVLLLLWSIKALREFKEGHNVAGVY